MPNKKKMPRKRVVRQRTPREKNNAYLVYIRGLECAHCGNDISVEAAHVRATCFEWSKVSPGIGAKPDDYWTVPLCSVHHMKQHSLGEQLYWFELRTDPFLLAAKLRIAYPDQELALHHIHWTRDEGRKRYVYHQRTKFHDRATAPINQAPQSRKTTTATEAASR